MKLLRHGPKGAERPAMLDAEGRARDLSDIVGDITPDLLAAGFGALQHVDPQSLPVVPEGARIGAPVAQVGKFVCIGLNYREHARETNLPEPKEPVLFMKATSAISGPSDDIILPPGSRKADWEVELGLVIGRECRYVSEADALAHVAGLCVVNDLSEREYQLERGGQWDKGKSCDSFGPVGPWLVTLDEVERLDALSLWLDVNGECMQAASTGDLIFSIPFLVHYVSQFMSLQPGDIISTGTPAGVGLGRNPQRWLQEGDIVSAGISGLGEQRQRVRRHGG